MKAVEIKTNKNGVQYGLFAVHTGLSADADDCTYAVYKLCENYNRHVKGGIAKTWRYVERGLSFEAALALFTKRSK
jgi:hypothetical protein